MPKVKVGDIEVNYIAVGSGRPLVLLHGGPGLGHYYLRPGFDVLSDSYKVIYYDQRGTGETPLGDPNKINFTGSIADLEGLRQSLGIERLNLIGHSFGAILGLLYSAEHPDRVASLVICDPGPPFVDKYMQQFGAAMQKRARSEDSKEKEELESSEEYKRREPKAVEQSFRLTYLPFFKNRQVADSTDFGFTKITARNAPEAGSRMFRDLADHKPVESLAKIKCPTLVVYAEPDPLPEAFSKFIAERIDGAEFTKLTDASHFAYLDKPDEFFGALRNFLAENAE